MTRQQEFASGAQLRDISHTIRADREFTALKSPAWVSKRNVRETRIQQHRVHHERTPRLRCHYARRICLSGFHKLRGVQQRPYQRLHANWARYGKALNRDCLRVAYVGVGRDSEGKWMKFHPGREGRDELLRSCLFPVYPGRFISSITGCRGGSRTFPPAFHSEWKLKNECVLHPVCRILIMSKIDSVYL